MKKHKVKIPKGYILVNETSSVDSKGMTITLGLEPLPMEKPIKKELPKTWEELETVGGYFIAGQSDIRKKVGVAALTDNRNAWPTKELAEAALALSQLLQLRDRYNESQETPVSHQDFCSIYRDAANNIVLEENISQGPLRFNTKEIGYKFQDAFKDLLETAKPLL